jgi:biotin carboxylase
MSSYVLIVCPFSSGRLYAKEFHKYGFKTVAFITPEIPERIKAQLIKEDFESIFETEEELMEFVKHNTIKAVVAGSEYGVEVAEELAFKLGLSGNDITVPALRRDKFKMQKALKEAGLAFIPTIILKEGESFDIPESKAGYILKPCKSSGSEGVHFAENKRELLTAIHNINWKAQNVHGVLNEEFLLQPFIEGTEYVVDLVAFEDGSIKVASVCEYEKCEANNSKFVYKSLKVLNPNNYSTLTGYAIKASKALGFKVGPIHMEIKNKDNPVMIEVGARLHGGVAPSLFEYCYKPPLLEASVDSYLGAKGRDAELIENGKIEFAINKNDCKVLQLNQNALEDLEKIEGYKGHRIFFKEGDVIPKTNDLATTPAICFLSNADDNRLEQSASKARVDLAKGIGI